jgi:hypothetical protein
MVILLSKYGETVIECVEMSGLACSIVARYSVLELSSDSKAVHIEFAKKCPLVCNILI